MLFSATLPHWVQKVARRYQRDPKTIDLVGEDQTGKLNEDVTLNVMQVRGHGVRWASSRPKYTHITYYSTMYMLQ